MQEDGGIRIGEAKAREVNNGVSVCGLTVAERLSGMLLIIVEVEVDKAIVESIRDFIGKCPLLKAEGDTFVNVDYQEKDIGTYMIETTPANLWVKRYVNGTGIKQFRFDFSSREIYSDDVLENIRKSNFYENFSEWLDESTRLGMLPVLSGTRKPMKIYATTGGYVYDSDHGTAQYIIQCNFEYFQF